MTVEKSSGDVFADLDLKNPEEMLAKAAVATLLGVDQPKVSALSRGKLDGVSIDRLFRFLNALGSDVEIVIRPAHRGKTAGT